MSYHTDESGPRRITFFNTCSNEFLPISQGVPISNYMNFFLTRITEPSLNLGQLFVHRISKSKFLKVHLSSILTCLLCPAEDLSDIASEALKD